MIKIHCDNNVNDLENIYSGGECGPLALFLNKKFNCQIYCISGIKNWDGSIITRAPYHYFVGFNSKYFDIFGWQNTFEGIIGNFKDFTPDCSLKVKKVKPKKVEICRFNYKPSKVEEDWKNYINDLWNSGTIDRSC
jgi:hypothetical protein